MQTSISYESLLGKILEIPMSKSATERQLLWTSEGQRLAVSKDPDGAIELFIVGERLHSQDSAIQASLDWRTWTDESAMAFDATRLKFPLEFHYSAVAALICVELHREGVETDYQAAFRNTERLISWAILKQQASNAVLIGLAGELILLKAFCEDTPEFASAFVRSWYGHERSSRDFQLGECGLEVKTTTGYVSQHSITGVHQVEIGHPVSDTPETHLYLASIGIQWLPGEETFTCTTLKDEIEAILGYLDSVDAKLFLEKVRRYGGDAEFTLEYGESKISEEFLNPFMTTFARLYDMNDDGLKILTSLDLAPFREVILGSVSFRISLPTHGLSAGFPLVGLETIAEHLVQKSS